MLYDQIGHYIERTYYHDSLDQYVDLLAFHHARSRNEARKREHLLKAGEAAQAAHANQMAVTLKLGQVLETVDRGLRE